MEDILKIKPLVIAALHLPYTRQGVLPSMAYLEDYVLQNTGVFVAGGIPAVILQDETLNAGMARPETLTTTAALGKLIRHEYPTLQLGIIIEAHDPVAPIAVAYAAGAGFVRIKVFVGSMLKSSGIKEGCGIAALDYRHSIGQDQIKIMADIHDRTGQPLLDIPIERASSWAASTGADALILTGSTYSESIQYLDRVRAAGIKRPLIMGGSADAGNVKDILAHADGVIVSSSLKRKNPSPDDIVLWERDAILRFMDSARMGGKD